MTVDGNGFPTGELRQIGHQPHPLVEPLERLPVDFQAHQSPAGPGGLSGLFRGEGLVADEPAFVQLHRPAEPQLVWGHLLGLDAGALRAGVVHVDQDKAGLQARDVHGQQTARRDPVRLPGRHQGIPNAYCGGCIEPDLVTQVTGVPRTRDQHVRAAQCRPGVPEEPQPVHVGVAGLPQDLPGVRTLER